ncbi:biopolymer transporter ExbD [Abyssibacter sp.]|jgi:biopolymer transport protein ExbD|uniref:ExbD/TolR family protein n=1 Tax=Abyssibacter sp. TaxID=2320200 RepID=UPI0025B7A7B9|nr:biopolymer transporter ExbD [Abyssibacter sp.]MCK5858872.1 biopolymer transporter ExbD [Abyssibacter sp.]
MRDFLSEGDDDAVDSEIDLTPMLDVVFIMLIFFIVTASFVKEAGFDVNRPPQSNQPPKKDEIKNILVSIAADGQLFINRRPVDAGALTANIKRLHAENPKGAVVIQAEDDSANERLITVMDAARKAGVYNVSIASN